MGRARALRAAAALAVAMGAGVLVTSRPAAGGPLPLTAPQVFFQREVVDPLVTALAVDGFAAPDGTSLHGWTETTGRTWTVHDGALRTTGQVVHLDAAPLAVATLSVGESDVFIAADLLFADADRASGLVLNRGPAGELRVVIATTGGDHLVGVTRVVGGVESLLEATGPIPGVPPVAALRVEKEADRIRVWLDGTLVIDRTLGGGEAAIIDQTDHGIVVGRPGDGIDDVLVLTRS